MQITVRTLLASVAATAVLAGAVGALATAATSSQASPQAIAAAVQQVQDHKTEKYLQTIGIELLRLDEHTQNATDGEMGQLDQLISALDNIRGNTYLVCWDTGSLEQRAGCSH